MCVTTYFSVRIDVDVERDVDDVYTAHEHAIICTFNDYYYIIWHTVKFKHTTRKNEHYNRAITKNAKWIKNLKQKRKKKSI